MRSTGRSPRRGFSLIWVLVLVTLTAGVSVELVRQIFMARQQARATEDGLRAEWAARAAIQWAGVRLKKDGKKAPLGTLPGEKWPAAVSLKLVDLDKDRVLVEAVGTSGQKPFTQRRTLRQEWNIPEKDFSGAKPVSALRVVELEPGK